VLPYRSTQFKELRNLPKDHAPLKAKARNRWYAVSFDDEAPQVVTLVPQNYNARNGNREWEKSVEDNARHGHTTHTLAKSGYHTLKFWMVDPSVVLQKLVVDPGGVKPSYLGPPESHWNGGEPKPH
jgi:hypothetical protein